MTWSPPHVESQNGKIRGYKIVFVPSEDYYDKQPHVATTTNQYYTIENAMKFTNYTISVLAYTSVGDGVKTKDFYCLTNEDCKLLFPFIYSVMEQPTNLFNIYSVAVPSAPKSIKAIPSSSSNIIVSWLPPKYRNGEIVSLCFLHFWK